MKKYRERGHRCGDTVTLTHQRKSSAVSEVLGTVLLLVIAISLFSVLTYLAFVIPDAFLPNPSPSVNIIGMIKGNSVILEHHGGESVPLSVQINLNFGGTPYVKTVGDVLDSKYKSKGGWDLGESIIIPYNDPNLPIMQISINIIDKDSNSVLMRGILQQGIANVLPIVTTLQADAITPNTATIHMSYDFRYANGTKKVCFMYIKASVYALNASAPWNSTGWITVGTQNGTYLYNLVGLSENTLYLYQAMIQYNSTLNASQVIDSGGIKMFQTESYAAGRWHFDENSGFIAIDSSGHKNNGTLFPQTLEQAPQRLNQSSAVQNRSLRFNGYNNYVTVNHDASLTPTSEIAIEGWVKPEYKTEYKINTIQPKNSTLFGYQQFGCYQPDMIKIADDRVAIVSVNSANRGLVYTTRISAQGYISRNATTSIVDILQFEPVRCETPRIIKIQASTDIYAIVYRGPNQYLYLATVQIFSNGTINKTIRAQVPIETNYYCYNPNIVVVNGDYYGVVYTAYQYYLAAWWFLGKIQTVRITSTGQITAKIDFHDFGSGGMISGIMRYPQIIRIHNENYSIFYRDSDFDGSLRAVHINDGDGQISYVNTSYKFDIDNISNYPMRILHVSGQVYAIFYGDLMGNFIRGPVIMTVQIADDGSLSNGLDYAQMLPPADWSGYADLEFVHVTGDVFAVSYRIGTLRAEIKTLEIFTNGTIRNHSSDAAWKYAFATLPPNTYNLNSPKIIEMNSSIHTYAVVYPKSIFYGLSSGSTNFANDMNTGVLATLQIAVNGSTAKTIIDSVLLGPVNFYAPDMVHVANDVYAVASRNTFNGGLSLYTLHISDGGKIDNHFIDSLALGKPEVWIGLSTKIVYVTNNIYLIAYDNYGNPAVTLKTVEIAADGSITDAVLCSYNITKPGYQAYCSINVIRIQNSIFAVSYHLTNYWGGNNDFISTLQISLTGNISIIGTFSRNGMILSPIKSSYPKVDEYTDLIPLEGSNHLYALVFSYDYFGWIDYNPTGWQHSLGIIATIQIFDNGTINQNPFTIYSFNPDGCLRPTLIHINQNIYALTFRDLQYISGWRLFLGIKTIDISSNGTMIKNVDAVSYDSWYVIPFAYSQILLPISNDGYAIIFTWPQDGSWNARCNGYIGALRIAKNGSIYRTTNNNCIDVQIRLYTHLNVGDSNVNVLPSCLKINDHMVVVCYQGNYDDGCIETFDLFTSNISKALKTILSKAGSYAIRGNDTIVTGTITTASGDKTLTLPLHKGWNYLVLNYDHSTLKFFNNLTNVSLPCNENIQSSNTPLVFGGFSGIYDEFAIYKIHLRDDEIYDHFTKLKP